MKGNVFQRGKASIAFEEGPLIIGCASVAGKKRGEGPLGELFDVIEPDPMVGRETWEQAESALQKEAADLAIERAGLVRSEVRYLFAGDLLSQLIATSFGTVDLEVPVFGLYGACSTIGEALCLGAMTVEAGYADYVMAMSLQPFRQRREAVPLSFGIWEPEALLGHLDRHRLRLLYSGKKGGHVRISESRREKSWIWALRIP